MKCPYCNEKLIEYKNDTTFEKLYYCGTEGCPKTYRLLASQPTWKTIKELKEEREKTDKDLTEALKALNEIITIEDYEEIFELAIKTIKEIQGE